MQVGPLTGYGRALRDYHAGAVDASLIVHSDLGEHDELPLSIFFRTPDEFFPFERDTLDLCRGTVLDLGAGTGVHSLAVQERGFSVRAVEIVPAALEIMQARGVRDVVRGDGFACDGEPADTLLMMMNGIGPTGTLDGLDDFLGRAGSLVKPSGQILMDSAKVQRREEAPGAPDVSWPPRTGDYIGEAWVRLEYRGELGPPFRELYLDFGTLADHAVRANWKSEVVSGEADGAYVARLTLATPGA